MIRRCGGASHRRLAVERGSLSTDSIATHRAISLVAWELCGVVVFREVRHAKFAPIQAV